MRKFFYRNNKISKTERTVRLAGIVACELFAAATIIMLLARRQFGRLPLAVGTVFMILIPEAVERLFRCKIVLPVYIFGLLYTIGPMLGQSHNLYYLVSWWDKLLHISGGVMFALFGIYLFGFLAGDCRRGILTAAVFALCFSMAVSVLWEFFEFGADRLVGTDMQDDTVITSIHSYALDEGVGVVGSIENIEEVSVNGTPLPTDGYLDIGLIDTMTDMLLESLGALAAVVIFLIDGGRHRVFIHEDPAGAQDI